MRSSPARAFWCGLERGLCHLGGPLTLQRDAVVLAARLRSWRWRKTRCWCRSVPTRPCAVADADSSDTAHLGSFRACTPMSSMPPARGPSGAPRGHQSRGRPVCRPPRRIFNLSASASPLCGRPRGWIYAADRTVPAVTSRIGSKSCTTIRPDRSVTLLSLLGRNQLRVFFTATGLCADTQEVRLRAAGTACARAQVTCHAGHGCSNWGTHVPSPRCALRIVPPPAVPPPLTSTRHAHIALADWVASAR